jgi:sugar/nucleoside kinase (ribokinase family)
VTIGQEADVEQAVSLANRAAARAVTRSGAASSIPTRKEIA